MGRHFQDDPSAKRASIELEQQMMPTAAPASSIIGEPDEAAYSSDFSLGLMRCGRLQMGKSTGTIIVSGPIKSSSITLCTCLSVMGQQKVMGRLLSRIVALLRQLY